MVEAGRGVGWGILKPVGLKRDLTHNSDILTFSFLPSFLHIFIQQSFIMPWRVLGAVVSAGGSKN